MKLSFLHLMPYTDLSEDFVQRHPSVWVDIDPALFDPAKANRVYERFAGGIAGPTSVRTIPGAGHLVDVDAPEAPADAVLAFLEA